MTSVCETCELPIAWDEQGWSDIWFTDAGVVYGPGGYKCSATAFRHPHEPRLAEICAHLIEMERELGA